MIDLARILHAAGVHTVVAPGWHERSAHGAQPRPVGVLNHHTATPSSERNPAPSVQLTINGRSDLAGPLCHVVIGADGTSHVIAAGRANHAGQARASGPNPAGDGNTLYLGVEWDYDGTHAPSAAQYNAAVQVNAALLRHLGRPAEAARAHKETSTTGKWDPGHVDMDRFRADVARAMSGATDMDLNDEFTDWAGTTKTIKGLFNDLDQRLAALHHVFLKPGAEPSRIPGDRNRTNLRDAIMDTAAEVLVGDGGVPPQPVPPVPLPHPVPETGSTPTPPPVDPMPEPVPKPRQPVDAPAPKPSRKPGRPVAAGSAAGAVGTVAVWIASLYGVEMPEPVAAAVVLVLSAGMSYLVPNPAPQHPEAPRR